MKTITWILFNFAEYIKIKISFGTLNYHRCTTVERSVSLFVRRWFMESKAQRKSLSKQTFIEKTSEIHKKKTNNIHTHKAQFYNALYKRGVQRGLQYIDLKT